MLNTKKIFINTDFTNSQLLWLIPIIHGYALEKKINCLIFKNNIPNHIYKNKIIQNILSNYKIIIFTENKFLIFYLYFLFLIKNISYHFFLIFFLNKKKVFNKNNDWYNYQIFHSVYDTTNLHTKTSSIIINFINKLKSIFIISYNIFVAENVCKKKVTTAFISHSVYSGRALLAVFRKNKVLVINQAFDSLYKQQNNFDVTWNFYEKKILSKFFNTNYIIKSNLYWNNRIKGKGIYEDSQTAFLGKTKRVITYKNVVFLHIFKDSPFNVLDKNRIFIDYFEWIYWTLKILQNTNEDWIFKEHPSCKEWGENSLKIFNNIYNKVFNFRRSPHIRYDQHKISNNEVFSSAKRIITFCGTSHLESACFGIKPIIISKTCLENYDKNMIIKPKNLNEYRKYLLINSNSRIFKLKNKEITKSKLILFFNEKIGTLKKQTGSVFEYRKTSKKILSHNLKKVLFNIQKNYNFFIKTGKLLSNTDNKNTFSKLFYYSSRK